MGEGPHRGYYWATECSTFRGGSELGGRGLSTPSSRLGEQSRGRRKRQPLRILWRDKGFISSRTYAKRDGVLTKGNAIFVRARERFAGSGEAGELNSFLNNFDILALIIRTKTVAVGPESSCSLPSFLPRGLVDCVSREGGRPSPALLLPTAKASSQGYFPITNLQPR